MDRAEASAASTGQLCVLGLGPGDAALMTEQVKQSIAGATDAFGYFPYVERLNGLDHLRLHASDNREELDRARHALNVAAEGKKVLMLSSGDPGVFAMASAVFEVLEQARPDEQSRWAAVDVEVLPGIEGLVHISELSWTKRVAKAEDVLAAGEVVSVKIKEINLESHRISLSLRDAEGDPWEEAAQQFAFDRGGQGNVSGGEVMVKKRGEAVLLRCAQDRSPLGHSDGCAGQFGLLGGVGLGARTQSRKRRSDPALWNHRCHRMTGPAYRLRNPSMRAVTVVSRAAMRSATDLRNC